MELGEHPVQLWAQNQTLPTDVQIRTLKIIIIMMEKLI